MPYISFLSTTEPVHYVVIDLGTNFNPSGINSSGTVVGNTFSSSATWHSGYLWTTPLAWNQGTPTNLSQNLTNGWAFYTVGIDDAGHVAGEVYYTVSPGPSWGTSGGGCYWSSLTADPQVIGAGTLYNNITPPGRDRVVRGGADEGHFQGRLYGGL